MTTPRAAAEPGAAAKDEDADELNLELPKYLKPLGMKCEVYWKEMNAHYSGTILDVRRKLRAKYADQKHGGQGTEQVVKKAFFVMYEDGDREWIEIKKFEALPGDGGVNKVRITESVQLEEFYDREAKAFAQGSTYEPKSIEERKQEEYEALRQAEKLKRELAAHKEQQRRDQEKRETLKRKASQMEATSREEAARAERERAVSKARLTLSREGEKELLKPPGKRMSLGGGVSRPRNEDQQPGGPPTGQREASPHDRRMENPKFRVCYEALCAAFGRGGGQPGEALRREDWRGWEEYKKVFEKGDEWWDNKEEEVAARARALLGSNR
mmetsp:Transcript_7938/g.23726  ORF Transcript_7938/g.23726 Transcript_7938/m.23726 type:complete len:327 (-) Transcript_7938:896-1876(-)